MFKKNLFYIFISVISISGVLNAQETSPITIKRNTIFFEALGNGLYMTYFNYDRIIAIHEKYKLAGRFGFSYFPTKKGESLIGLPLEISYLKGVEKNYLELGIGQTFHYENDRFKTLAIISCFRIGYRYQKNEGGFFFKTGLTPLGWVTLDLRKYIDNKERFELNDLKERKPIFIPWIGIAAGYTLKK
jgi:hypothetical protein